MDFYFVNHKGKKIDFSDYPYLFQSGDLLDYQYKYTSVEGQGRNVTRGYRKAPKEFQVQIAVLCDFNIPRSERYNEWKEAVNYLV